MSTHNLCFCREIKKTIGTFWLKKVPYQELCTLTLYELHNAKLCLQGKCGQQRPSSVCMYAYSAQDICYLLKE